MTRKAMITLAVGGVAALALAGTAIGAAASDVSTSRQGTSIGARYAPASTAPAAPTEGTDPTGPASTAPAPTDGTPGTTTAPATPPASGGEVTEQQAREIALARVGGGTVTEVERDRDDNRPVWEVEIKWNGVEYDIDIDRETAEILEFDQDDDD